MLLSSSFRNSFWSYRNWCGSGWRDCNRIISSWHWSRCWSWISSGTRRGSIRNRSWIRYRNRSRTRRCSTRNRCWSRIWNCSWRRELSYWSWFWSRNCCRWSRWSSLRNWSRIRVRYSGRWSRWCSSRNWCRIWLRHSCRWSWRRSLRNWRWIWLGYCSRCSWRCCLRYRTRIWIRDSSWIIGDSNWIWIGTRNRFWIRSWKLLNSYSLSCK